MNAFSEVIPWLLTGDVSIQYQVWRDLLGKEKPALQKRIAQEGWGKRFLSFRKRDGYWGKSFYQPKWISTHYTLLDLKHLGVSSDVTAIRESVARILREEKSADGGVNPSSGIPDSDVCVNGMVLNYASYFRADAAALRSLVDFLLGQRMGDGGFNCWSNRQGAVHSSLHTTLSVLEGILEYRRNGYTHRVKELEAAEKSGREFILMHRLFRSDKTGEIINPAFLQLRYPGRWFYDILRALDHFQNAHVPTDSRMEDALKVILKKRTKDGVWKRHSGPSGLVHFDMESAGAPSRWNTLRALRVLKRYLPEEFREYNAKGLKA